MLRKVGGGSSFNFILHAYVIIALNCWLTLNSVDHD